MPTDIYGYPQVGTSGPLIGAFSITPSDVTDLPNNTRQIRVTGIAGNLVAIWQDGQTRTIPVAANDVLDWRVSRVLATGTTATGLWGFY